MYLAEYVDAKHVIFFADGAGKVEEVDRVEEAPAPVREGAMKRYEDALSQCKALVSADSEQIVRKAFEHVHAEHKGSLHRQGSIQYRVEAGADGFEGQLLCAALIGNFGALKNDSKKVQWMESHWREVCAEADVDGSGGISEVEAVAVWDSVLLAITSCIAEKLHKLGAPPRLYRGDLVSVTLPGEHADAAAPHKRVLAFHVDSTHAILFDDGGEVVQQASPSRVT